MAGSSSTFLLSAADASWGTREKSCVTVNLAAAALDGLYFELGAPASAGGAEVEYYVWFDLDAGSVDPAPAGKTGIEVDIVTGDTSAEIAVKMQLVLEAELGFRATVEGAVVTIEPEYIGAVTATADGDTTFDFVQATLGLGGSLGLTSGGITLEMASEAVDILADQTGKLKLDSVQVGSEVSVTMSLLEMTQERWKSIVGGVAGDTFTPSGGSELVGIGESRLYSSLFDLGGELVLHPTRLDASDRTQNVTIWKSAPQPASYNWSGEEASVMEVTFSALADRSLEDAISVMAFGDNEQDVRK